jgi:hypothetical protein
MFSQGAPPPLDSDLTTIAGLTATTDSIMQAKSSAWAARTLAQVLADLGAVGKFPFPATQVPSAGANDLDDYEEGTWTPVLTFATAGDLSVAYSVQAADYSKVGRLVVVSLSITTSTFTHTTASGNLRITGLPFTVGGSFNHYGAMLMTGITKASYTNFVLQAVNGQTYLQVQASASAQTASAVGTADAATAVQKTINGTVAWWV